MNPYKNLPSDTPEHIRKIQHEIVMSKSLGERVRMCCEMADFAMEMLRSQIKNKRPDISPAELKFEAVKALYADCYSDEEFARIKEHFLRYA